MKESHALFSQRSIYKDAGNYIIDNQHRVVYCRTTGRPNVHNLATIKKFSVENMGGNNLQQS